MTLETKDWLIEGEARLGVLEAKVCVSDLESSKEETIELSRPIEKETDLVRLPLTLTEGNTVDDCDLLSETGSLEADLDLPKLVNATESIGLGEENGEGVARIVVVPLSEGGLGSAGTSVVEEDGDAVLVAVEETLPLADGKPETLSITLNDGVAGADTLSMGEIESLPLSLRDGVTEVDALSLGEGEAKLILLSVCEAFAEADALSLEEG